MSIQAALGRATIRDKLKRVGGQRRRALEKVHGIDEEALALAMEADKLGVSRSEIARLIGINRNTLYIWLEER